MPRPSPRPLLGLLLAFTACAHTKPVLAPDVQAGPASAVAPGRVLALHANCGSVEYRCPREYGQTVDAIVRGGLEFAGYSVVDDDVLRKDTRQRHDERVETNTTESKRSRTDDRLLLVPVGRETTSSEGSRHSETETTVLDGANFEDLSVAERHEVLARSGAASVLSVRVVVGGQAGVWVPNQNVEVMVKLGVDHGDAMAWASRCTASSNDFSTVTAALEQAARCAIKGASSPHP